PVQAALCTIARLVWLGDADRPRLGAGHRALCSITSAEARSGGCIEGARLMWERFKRWPWAILIAAAVLLGLVYAFWPASTPVDAAQVTYAPMAVGVSDDGVTRSEEFYVVSAPVTVYLSRIELEPGDPVTRNMIVAWMTGRPATPLDPRARQELANALAAAEAAATGAQASLTQARRDLTRAEELSERGFLARAQ